MLTKEFHASRRERYAELMLDNSVGFLFAGKEIGDRGDEVFPFTPYANFYYLTGFRYPKAILMIVKVAGRVRTTLFIDHPDEKAKRWLGVVYSAESVSEETGIEDVRYLETFEDSIPLHYHPGTIRQVYVDYANWNSSLEANEAQAFAARIAAANPGLPIYNTFNDLAIMRQVKGEPEIECHREACRITDLGVRNILKHLHPGMKECEAEAYFDFVLKCHGAGHAFGTIAAAGINACCMHYSDNNCVAEDGDMILFDLGAEWGYYGADVSRTYPVNGKFTEQQKQLYNVVLKGLEAAEKASVPGQIKNDLQLISKRVMAEELVKIGFIKEPEEINNYYFHGSGHYIGLYTHDVGDDNAPLEKDMVFTLEPGLYFDDLKLGIRIEDTLVVTEDGVDILTDCIPKTVEDIESFMAANRE